MQTIHKAQWFKNAAIEARRKKELFAQEQQRAKIQAEQDREKDQIWTVIFVVVGIVVIIAFLIYLFS